MKHATGAPVGPEALLAGDRAGAGGRETLSRPGIRDVRPAVTLPAVAAAAICAVPRAARTRGRVRSPPSRPTRAAARCRRPRCRRRIDDQQQQADLAAMPSRISGLRSSPNAKRRHLRMAAQEDVDHLRHDDGREAGGGGLQVERIACAPSGSPYFQPPLASSTKKNAAIAAAASQHAEEQVGAREQRPGQQPLAARARRPPHHARGRAVRRPAPAPAACRCRGRPRGSG